MPPLNFYEKISILSKYFPVPNLHYIASRLPVFPVHSSQVKVLNDPSEFYDELLQRASTAKNRILISSLYIGTGSMEKNLVDVIGSQIHKNPHLKVCWLLDRNRASRGKFNSCSLLLPFVNNRFDVYLYHTPRLRGFLKYLIPERWNETIGLQHMKVYVFDDSIVMSGANLSNDYFTNRQDRYLVISNCNEVATFYENLINIISKFSLKLEKDNTLSTEIDDKRLHPYKGNFQMFCDTMRDSVQLFWNKECEKSLKKLDDVLALKMNDTIESKQNFVQSNTNNLKCDSKTELLDHPPNSNITLANKDTLPDTLIFPTLQISHSNITLDSDVTLNLITTPEGEVQHSYKYNLASGYFNLTNQYVNAIVNKSLVMFDILCAHPSANGFLGAKGAAGAIPHAYTQLSNIFHSVVLKSQRKDKISLYEYSKPGWTFHAKGLWVTMPDRKNPFMTLIGSPNFGYRSVHRDLESQLLVCTSSTDLSEQFGHEQNSLFVRSQLVESSTFEAPDRRVPVWVKFILPFIRNFF